MFASFSVFLEFNLPNATTWFYFSLLLATAIFFKFSRVLCVRNLDLLLLFALVPPMLIVQAFRPTPPTPERHPALLASSVAALGGATPLATLVSAKTLARERFTHDEAVRRQWYGYLWLLCGSGILFLRCLFDLVLVQRPLLPPNLTIGGLGWMTLTLIVCLTAVVFRQTDGPRPASQPAGGDGNVNPQRRQGPESASATVARQWVDPTSMWMRGFAMVGHLAVVLGLMVIGRLHFQDITAGMGAATLYLMLPYVGMYVREADHVWPVAMVVWAVAAYPWPAVCGSLLGVAAGAMYFPLLTLPVFWSFYRKRGAGRFVFFFVVSGAAVLGAVAIGLSVQGELDAAVRRAMSLASWQPWRAPPADLEGFWTGSHHAYRIPTFLVYTVFVLATAFWPTPKNLAQVLALTTAILIGTQFWYADQGGTYVLWHLPLFLLVAFRPNLEQAAPATIVPETDWVCRLQAWVFGRFRRAKAPLPAAPARAA